MGKVEIGGKGTRARESQMDEDVGNKKKKNDRQVSERCDVMIGMIGRRGEGGGERKN